MISAATFQLRCNKARNFHRLSYDPDWLLISIVHWDTHCDRVENARDLQSLFATTFSYFFRSPNPNSRRYIGKVINSLLLLIYLRDEYFDMCPVVVIRRSTPTSCYRMNIFVCISSCRRKFRHWVLIKKFDCQQIFPSMISHSGEDEPVAITTWLEHSMIHLRNTTSCRRHASRIESTDVSVSHPKYTKIWLFDKNPIINFLWRLREDIRLFDGSVDSKSWSFTLMRSLHPHEIISTWVVAVIQCDIYRNTETFRPKFHGYLITIGKGTATTSWGRREITLLSCLDPSVGILSEMFSNKISSECISRNGSWNFFRDHEGQMTALDCRLLSLTVQSYHRKLMNRSWKGFMTFLSNFPFLWFLIFQSKCETCTWITIHDAWFVFLCRSVDNGYSVVVTRIRVYLLITCNVFTVYQDNLQTDTALFSYWFTEVTSALKRCADASRWINKYEWETRADLCHSFAGSRFIDSDGLSREDIRVFDGHLPWRWNRLFCQYDVWYD